MKIHLNIIVRAFIIPIFYSASLSAQHVEEKGYILEFEENIAEVDSLHFGRGTAIGYSFFKDVSDFDYVFRKRVLKPGAEIRYHLQEEDEIYYILSGKGEMKMNDETFEVNPGFAILTRSGSSHGLTASGEEDLVIIIVYEKEPIK